jgi:hypothetical protein
MPPRSQNDRSKSHEQQRAIQPRDSASTLADHFSGRIAKTNVRNELIVSSFLDLLSHNAYDNTCAGYPSLNSTPEGEWRQSVGFAMVKTRKSLSTDCSGGVNSF